MQLKLLAFILLFSGVCHSQNYKFGKVSKEEIEEAQHPEYPEADAAILYREISTEFNYSENDGFYTVTNVFERIKIYKPEGFDWATHQVSLYNESSKSREELSGLKAYTYHLDEKGKVDEIKLKKDGMFEEEKNKYYKVEKFTMPSIKEGSVIEYEYSIKSPLISNINPFRLQESIPVNKVYIRFKAPEYFNYNKHTTGWLPFNIEESSKERSMDYRYTRSFVDTKSAIGNTTTETINFRENIYEVTLEKVAPIIKESYAGNINNYMASLVFELGFTKFPNNGLEMYATDWEAVSKKIYQSPNFGGQLDNTRIFKKDIDKLLANTTTEAEKTIAIYEYVKNAMNHNGYTGIYTDDGVKNAYNEKVGSVSEINLLLVSMFKYAGINASPIVLSTKSNGIPIFPTRTGFNYVIAGVEQNGFVQFFDACDKQGAPNVLDASLLNWQGRLVREDGSSAWVPLTASQSSKETIMMSASIDDTGVIVGKARGQYTDYLALERRNNYIDMSPDQIKAKVKMDQMNMSNFSIKNLEDAYQPVVMQYDFETSDFVEEIDGKMYLSPMLFLAINENPFKLEDRKYPIDYGYPQTHKYIINLAIPEAYKVESIPESANMVVGGNLMNFKYLVNNANAKIQVMVDFSINASLVNPENYSDVKKFYQDLIDKESEKIVLSKV